jgi:hypothetical protein
VLVGIGVPSKVIRGETLEVDVWVLVPEIVEEDESVLVAVIAPEGVCVPVRVPDSEEVEDGVEEGLGSTD